MAELLDNAAILDDVRLAYRDRGHGEPVVFLHGTPSHSFIWRSIVGEVERAGHRVVLFDLLGYGRSERPLARDTSVRGQVAVLNSCCATWASTRFPWLLTTLVVPSRNDSPRLSPAECAS